MITTLLTVGSRYPVSRKAIRACVVRVLGEHNVVDAIVSVSVVGSRRIAELNKKHMHKDGTTDVLSFPQHDPEQPEKEFPANVQIPDAPMNLGDVVVCFPVAVEQAMKRGHLVDEQICSLVEHGLLHLLGFHHD